LLRQAAETVRSRVTGLNSAPEQKVAQPPSEQSTIDGLKTESKVRMAVQQVLWKQGSATSEEVDALTKAVLERMSKGPVR
jgi:hypothetical protein